MEPPSITAFREVEIKNFRDSGYTNQTNNNLGPNASLGFKVGDQGVWDLNGYYNAISYTGNIINSIYTVNGQTGFLNYPLVPFGGATNQTMLTPGAIVAAGATPPKGGAAQTLGQLSLAATRSRPAHGATSSALSARTTGTTGPSPATFVTSTRRGPSKNPSMADTPVKLSRCPSTTTPTFTI